MDSPGIPFRAQVNRDTLSGTREQGLFNTLEAAYPFGHFLAAGYGTVSKLPSLKQLPNIVYVDNRSLIFIIETCALTARGGVPAARCSENYSI
jgi:hypothetical protein